MKNNDRNMVCWRLYPSSLCNTFLNIPTVKWAETQPHEFKWALNADGFSLSCCYQFIFSIWVLKRQIEASPLPFYPSQLPLRDKGGQKSRKFLIPLHSTPRAPKYKPNRSHNASLLANFGFLPQRSASILNGNYYSLTLTHTHKRTHKHMRTHASLYTHYLDCTNEMQKTKKKRRRGRSSRKMKNGKTKRTKSKSEKRGR